MLAALAAIAIVISGPLAVLAQEPIQNWPPDDNSVGPYASEPQQYGQVVPRSQPNGSIEPQQDSYAQPGYQPNEPYGQQPYPSTPQVYGQSGLGQQSAQMQPLNPDQLTQLVAPIALYPDALIAQILSAATYPAQVSVADQWRRSVGNAPPEQIAAGADAQSSWDPSVKALTAFPQVLAMMDQNLQWTTELGNAYYNQPQDVLQTIQVMRQRAEQAGSLQSTPQEQVTDDQGTIGIAPMNPDEVYLPQYDPWQVYGEPVTPYPGFSLLGEIGSFVGNAFVSYGPGIAMNAFLTTPWGWLGWGLDWLAHAILFDHAGYWTHSTSVRDWGFPYGGPRYHGGRYWDHDRVWGRDWGHGGRRDGWGRDGYGRGYRSGGIGRPVGGPIRGYGDARTIEGFNRGFPSRNSGYGNSWNPGREANNRYPQAYGRPQQFAGGRQSYASEPGNRGGRNGAYGREGYGNSDPTNGRFAGRPGMAFTSPSPGSRGGNAWASAGGRNYGGRSYGGYSNGFSSSQRSGGSRWFGGGHSSNSYKAPKSYSFGSGHSNWGGGGWKAPKQSRSFGGGHSGWSGGGHSSGGHSGGGHWGGGGHSGGGGHGHHR